MRAYVAEYARPEKASDTTRGAPSAWKLLTMMPRQAGTKARRLHASDLDSAAVIVNQFVVALFFAGEMRSNNVNGLWYFQKSVLSEGGQNWHN
jgi:hypothetical protein